MEERIDEQRSAEAPALIGVELIRPIGFGVSALAAFFACAALSGWPPFTRSPADALPHADPTHLLRALDLREPMALNAAVAQLRLDQLQAEAVRSAVTRGVLSLGEISVRDWADQDGDVVSIQSAGFTQNVPISATPVVVVVPYAGAGEAIITALRDGGGGITVSVTGQGAEMRLRPLLTGQSIGVPLP